MQEYSKKTIRTPNLFKYYLIKKSSKTQRGKTTYSKFNN